MWHDAGEMRPTQRTNFALGLFATLVAVGLASAWLASRPPAIAIGTSYPGAVLLWLAAGLSLAAAGCLAIATYPDEPFGRLAAVASLAWFAAGWASPGTGDRPAVHGSAWCCRPQLQPSSRSGPHVRRGAAWTGPSASW